MGGELPLSDQRVSPEDEENIREEIKTRNRFERMHKMINLLIKRPAPELQDKITRESKKIRDTEASSES